MKRELALTLLSVMTAVIRLASPGFAQQDRTPPGGRPDLSFEQVREGFASPDMRYAPFAFWFWDAPLDPGQTADMATEMASQGLNPGYAHPRHGLPHDQWLTEPWFQAFEAAAASAAQQGAYLGYCDEYWWPSGRADGRVLAAHPELAAISLDCTTLDVPSGASIRCPASYVTVAARLAQALPAPTHRPSLGEWVWCPDAIGEGRSAWFRSSVIIPHDQVVESASIIVTADNSFRLFVNGRAVADGSDWTEPVLADIGHALHTGTNTIAVEAHNDDGPCGLNFGVSIRLVGGDVLRTLSGPGCRTTAERAEGWERPDFDDASWALPVRLGGPGAAPWSIGAYADRRIPRTILSTSLHRLGAGEAFDWTAPAGDWRVYSFTKVHRPGIDGGDVNYLDRRLAPAFIAEAHAPYERRLGSLLGATTPGVFVDNEGDYGYKLAWSEDLEREYREATDADLALGLPLLLDRDAEGRWPKARYDWYRTVSTIYADGFFGAVSRWLEGRGMYCISNLWEESLTAQAYAVGDFFGAQRSVTMPGNDCLVRKPLLVHDFKETQSVSEFENRRFQSEILGVAGWEMTPVLMKQSANAVVAWGVSHIVPHGVNLNRQLNTIPYPPDWFTSNPYWPWMRLWTDFCRRACFVNSCGHAAPDVLLLNPMDSVWALLGGRIFDPAQPVSFGELFDSSAPTGEPGPSLDAIEKVYSRAIDELTSARVQYLIADDHYLRQMAVEQGGGLRREPFEFRAVVVPSMFAMPLDVAEILVRFAEAGGPVYLLGDLPVASTDHGLDDPAMAALMRRLSAAPSARRCPEGIATAIARGDEVLAPHAEFVQGQFPVLDLHRRIDGRDFFWLANNTGQRRDCELLFRGAVGAATIWDCGSGEITPLASSQTAGGSRAALRIEPYQAFWVVFDLEQQALADPGHAEAVLDSGVAVEGPWHVRFDPATQPPPPVAGPGPDVPERFLQRQGAVVALAPWSEWGLDDFSGYLDYSSSLTIRPDASRVVLDLGEVRHVAEVWVNGEPAGRRAWPPFEFDIGRLVHPGDNEIRVRVGNLLCNQMRAYGLSGWTAPTEEDFRSGLIGPVMVVQAR